MKLPRKANLLYVFQTGYGLVQLPLGLFSFATTIYYLLVNNIPFLKTIFPDFWLFLLTGGVFGIPFCLLLGQWFIHSELQKASTRVHPYSNLLIPTQMPMYRAMARLVRAEGYVLEAEALEELVRRSEKF